jgi:hypothetical protein
MHRAAARIGQDQPARSPLLGRKSETQAPKFEVPQCSDFVSDGDAPQYTTAGAADVAQVFGSYYAAHP